MGEMHNRLPAWCERRRESRDGRYVVACYFTREGHPVSKSRADRVQLTEYDTEGNPLRVDEGIIRPAPVEQHPFPFHALQRATR